MAKIDIEPKGRFSTALKIAIEAHNLSLTDVAQKADTTYEHMRKMVGGRAYPSVHLLKALASALGADRKEWMKFIEADKLHKKYKTLPEFLGISPELERFQTIIPALPPEAQDTLYAMAKTLQKQYASHSR